MWGFSNIQSTHKKGVGKEMTEYNKAKHLKLIEVGKKLEKKTTHQLEQPFVESILQTLQFFGADQAANHQFVIDLRIAKYKIWDFLGMNYDSEYMQSKPVFQGLDKLVDLYIRMENVGGWAWFLRGHDLEVEEPKKCEDCIKSYDEWHNQTPEERMAEQEEREKIFGEVFD